MNHYYLLMIIIVSMGVIGGVINFFVLYSGDNSWQYFLMKNIVIGIGASILVPLFLNAASSELLQEDFAEDHWYFLFAGFCLGAVLLSQLFLRKSSGNSDRTTVPDERIGYPIYQEPSPPSLSQGMPEPMASQPEPTDEPEVSSARTPVHHHPPDKISDEAKRVMAILKQPNYIFKSVDEIVTEVDFERESLLYILESLEKAGLVTKIKREQEHLWGLTYKGYNFDIYRQSS